LDVDRALTELKERISGGWQSRHRRTIEYRAFVRLLIAQHRIPEALALLKWLLKIAEQWDLSGRIIHMKALEAIAFQAQGNTEKAIAALERALTLAEPEGYVRTLVDYGEAMARLLDQAVARGIAPRYARSLLASFEPKQDQPAPDLPTVEQSTPLLPLETLSERELQVLRLLPTRLSTPEIAAELYVSVHTVRSHVKNIYDKLSVHRRADAVQRAQELHLI